MSGVTPAGRRFSPQLTSVPVPGGHSVLWDDPDETAAAVSRYLAG